MLNTSKQYHLNSTWQGKQEALIASLRTQPLVVVLRPNQQELDTINRESSFFTLIEKLHIQGVRHIEIGWSAHPKWMWLMKELQKNFKEVSLGAASITCSSALRSIAELNLNYAMTPVWDPFLQNKAKELNQVVVPGVFKPSEIQQASRFGFQLIKLFPASKLGIKYLPKLKTLFNSLPFVIAAGGLKVSNINPWLNEGYGAIALGRNLVKDGEVESSLQTWLKSQITIKNQNFISYKLK